MRPRSLSKIDIIVALMLLSCLLPGYALSLDDAPKVSKDAATQAVVFAQNLPSAAVDNLQQDERLIYKSVDAEGRVSFGDRPRLNAIKLEAIEWPVYQQSEAAQDLQTRLDQMATTTKRLQEDRELRETQRKQKDDSRDKGSAGLYPPVVIEREVVYLPRGRRGPEYPYLYPPNHYAGQHEQSKYRSNSSLGLHIGGGDTKFHYGLSYGSQQRRDQDRADIQTPYHGEQGHKRRNGLRKPSRSERK